GSGADPAARDGRPTPDGRAGYPGSPDPHDAAAASEQGVPMSTSHTPVRAARLGVAAALLSAIALVAGPTHATPVRAMPPFAVCDGSAAARFTPGLTSTPRPVRIHEQVHLVCRGPLNGAPVTGWLRTTITATLSCATPTGSQRGRAR